MFSPRGLLMLAQTEHEVRGYRRTVIANQLQGVATEWVSPKRIKDMPLIINIDGPRYIRFWAVLSGTRRHRAP